MDSLEADLMSEVFKTSGFKIEDYEPCEFYYSHGGIFLGDTKGNYIFAGYWAQMEEKNIPKA